MSPEYAALFSIKAAIVFHRLRLFLPSFFLLSTSKHAFVGYSFPFEFHDSKIPVGKRIAPVMGPT